MRLREEIEDLKRRIQCAGALQERNTKKMGFRWSRGAIVMKKKLVDWEVLSNSE